MGSYWSGPMVGRKVAAALLAILSASLLSPVVYALGPDGPFALTISAPMDLSVKAGNGNLTLEWSPPEKGAGTMTGYRIFRARGDADLTLLTTLAPDRLFHIDVGLDNGATYRYRMTAFNSIEESEATPTVQGVPDGTAPTLSIISPSEGVFIPNSSVTVRWTAEDRGSGLSRIKVALDGEAPFDNGLSSSVELGPLGNGAHVVVVKAEDRAGNERTAAVGFTVDTATPYLRILSPYEGEVTTSARVTVSWAAEDEHAGIRSFLYRYDGEGSVELPNSVTERTVTATNGRHTVSLSATDRAGNSVSTRVNFTVDLEDPVLLVLTPEDGSYLNSSSVSCAWYAADSATGLKTEVRLDLGPLSVIGEGSNITYDGLMDGWHKLDMKVTDGAGRTAEAITRFMVDTVSPELEVTYPDIDRPVNTEETVLTWKVLESGSGLKYCYISVDGGSYKRSDRFDSGTVKLTEEGPHDITVMAEDRAGNRGTVSFVLVLDTTAPQLVSVGPRGDNVKELRSVWALFDEDLDPQTFVVTMNGVLIPAALDGLRNLTIVPSGQTLFGTEYNISIRAEDLAGNPSGDVSWSFTITDMGRVKGLIVDEGGRPLGGALVVLEDGSTYVCGDDGAYEMGVRMGERAIYFTADAHKRHRAIVRIDPIEVTDLGIIVLESDGPKEKDFLEWFLEDPVTLVLAALFLVILVLGAVNLMAFLKDKGILKRGKDARPRGDVKVRVKDLKDERKARRGSRFSSGRRL